VLLLLPLLAALTVPINAQQPGSPAIHIYREVDGRALRAYVFSPSARNDRAPASAILLFHGGGWSAGSPEWTFEAAGRFAALGMVAIPIEYRLSEGKVTPIEALADVCAAFRWARQKAGELGIDPKRVAGYGVSAGGHLVASAATVGCPPGAPGSIRAEPDALLLWSPALDLSKDRWFQEKLQGRATAATYSPAEHVNASTPPTIIVHGAEDVLAPLSGAKRYCERLVQAGEVCELSAYAGLGHLLTRNLANQESDFGPDPKARADGIAKLQRFLSDLGFIAGRGPGVAP
jgi:acetyl esterase/lipase